MMKSGLVFALMAAAFLPLTLAKLKKTDHPNLRDGDLVFQNSRSFQCEAVMAATKSKYSHVGMIFIEGGTPFVYEAVQPVKRTSLKTWIARGENGHYVAMRLKDPGKLDTAKLKKETKRYLGRNYDFLFDWSDETIYCSELVWKAYHRGCGITLAELRELREFDLDHPIVRPHVQQRYGDHPPLDMKVIAPSDLRESKLLMTVQP